MDTEKAVGAPAISVSGDGLLAYAVMDAVAPVPSVTDLLEALGRSGIRYGILHDVLESVASGPSGNAPLLVASGKAPLRGENGRIEWLFSPGPGTKAMFRNAFAGQRLASVHPPGAGVAGISVLGDPIPPLPGKPAHLHTGPNTACDPSDPESVVATVDGNVVFTESSIEVQPVLTVSGQLDYGRGDIDFAGSLVVTGDIRGDIAIRVKGSLTVHGSVEDADIQAGGDVTVGKGFVGRGKGRIAAGGNVTLVHLLNQSVVAGKDVLIAREAVNGSVSAGGNILAPRAVIEGGVLNSEGDIVVNTVGASDGLQAKLCAGRRGKILERLPALDRELRQAEAQVCEIKEAIYRMVRLQIDAGKLDEAHEESLRKLRSAQKLLPERIAALRSEQAGLKESLKKSRDVTVTVRETVFENTMVDINGSKKLVDSALLGVIFRERNGAIEVSSC